jgi:hypothetical protein
VSNLRKSKYLEKLLVAFVVVFSLAYILVFLGGCLYYHAVLPLCYGIAILGIVTVLYVVVWAFQTKKRELGGVEYAES